eukprot:scaffold5340_cov131-Isochrysis_galbana.AAC.1
MHWAGEKIKDFSRQAAHPKTSKGSGTAAAPCASEGAPGGRVAAAPCPFLGEPPPPVAACAGPAVSPPPSTPTALPPQGPPHAACEAVPGETVAGVSGADERSARVSVPRTAS